MVRRRQLPETPFIRSVRLLRDEVPGFDRYPYSIPAVRHLDELVMDDVTIFVGENASGKSTLIEAIAVAAGFNPEGAGATSPSPPTRLTRPSSRRCAWYGACGGPAPASSCAPRRTTTSPPRSSGSTTSLTQAPRSRRRTAASRTCAPTGSPSSRWRPTASAATASTSSTSPRRHSRRTGACACCSVSSNSSPAAASHPRDPRSPPHGLSGRDHLPHRRHGDPNSSLRGARARPPDARLPRRPEPLHRRPPRRVSRGERGRPLPPRPRTPHPSDPRDRPPHNFRRTVARAPVTAAAAATTRVGIADNPVGSQGRARVCQSVGLPRLVRIRSQPPVPPSRRSSRDQTDRSPWNHNGDKTGRGCAASNCLQRCDYPRQREGLQRSVMVIGQNTEATALPSSLNPPPRVLVSPPLQRPRRRRRVIRRPWPSHVFMPKHVSCAVEQFHIDRQNHWLITQNERTRLVYSIG